MTRPGMCVKDVKGSILILYRLLANKVTENVKKDHVRIDCLSKSEVFLVIREKFKTKQAKRDHAFQSKPFHSCGQEHD